MRKIVFLLVLVVFLVPLGAQNVPVAPYPQAAITFASSGDNTVVSAVTGKGICVYGLYFTAAAATNVTIKDGASNNLTGAMAFTANGAGFWPMRDNAKSPWWTTGAGNAFVINSSNAVQISGAVIYAPCLI